MTKNFHLLILLICALSSCLLPSEKGKVSLNLSSKDQEARDRSKKGQASVASVSLVNDEIVITGTDLDGVTKVKVTQSGSDSLLSIVSKSATKLILSSSSKVALALNTLMTLTLEDAYGAAVIEVTFNLPDSSVSTAKIGDDQVTTAKIADGAITSVKLSSMGALTGQLLRWNGSSWVAADLDALTYAGTWDASLGGNPNPSAVGGEYYIVSNDGVSDPGDGNSRSWSQGDWIVYNDVTASWDQISNSSDVTSFNGRTGGIVPTTGDYTWAQIDKSTSSIGDIGDIDLSTAPTTGQVLKFDGTRWIADTDNDSGVSNDSVTSTSIADGSIVDADVSGSAAIAWSKIDKTGATNSDVGLGNVDNIQQMPLSYLDQAATLGTDANKVPSQNAVKTYVDNATSGMGSVTSITGGAALSDGPYTTTGTIDVQVDDSTIEVATDALQVKALGIQSGHIASGAVTNAKITSVADTKITTACSDGEILSASSGNFVCAQASSVGNWILSGSDLYYSAGNIGIGTSTPSDPLTVSGIARADRMAVGATASVGGNTTFNVDDGRSQFRATTSSPVITGISEVGGNSIHPIFRFYKKRSGATAPQVGFGGSNEFSLEGATDGSNVVAAVQEWGWENSQSNDTTDRDSYFAFYTTQDDVLSEAMRINSQGFVGIGTTTPTTALEVSGVITASGFNGPVTSTSASVGAGSAANPSYTFSSDSNTGFYSGSADTIEVSLGGSNIFDMTTTEIRSSTVGGGVLRTVASSAATPTFTFNGDEDTGWFSPAADTLAASTGGVERIRIDNTGKVAIGRSTPREELHIHKNAGNDGADLILSNSTIEAPFLNQELGSLWFGSDEGNGYKSAGIQGLAAADFNSSDHPSILSFLTTPSGSGSAEERMRITETGNVGIGTINPAEKLVVNDGFGFFKTSTDVDSGLSIQSSTQARYWITSNRGDGNYLNFSTGSNPGDSRDNILVLTSGGNIGVGTASPEANFHVAGDESILSNDYHILRNKVSHGDPDYNTNQFYLLVMKRNIAGALVGNITSSRYTGSAGRYLSAEIAFNSSSSTYNTLTGDIFKVLNKGASESILGWSEIEYNGDIWAAIRIESNSIIHAMDWNFHGFANANIRVESDWMKLVQDDDPLITNIVATYSNRKLDNELFAYSSEDATYGRSLRAANNFIIDGNLGVGVASPTAKVDVNGVVKASSFEGAVAASNIASDGGSASAPGYSFSGDSDTGFYSATADTLEVTVGGSNIFDFNGTGLVSPTVGGGVFKTSNGTAALPTFSFAGDEDTGWFRPGADMLAASNGGTESMRIDASGNIGIGTISPSGLLTGTGTRRQHIRSTNGSAELNIDHGGNSLGHKAGLTLSSSGTPVGFIRTEKSTTGAIDAGLAFGTHNGSALAERMRITREGYVGINNNDPDERLHVSGAIMLGGRTLANSDGDVTTTVLPYQGAFIGWNEDNGGGRTHFLNHRGTGNGGWQFDSYNTDGTYDRTVMHLRGNNGNVGIGTVSPVSRLDVNVDTDNSSVVSFRNNSQFQVANNNNTNGSVSFMRTEVAGDGYHFGTVFNANQDVDFVIRKELTSQSNDVELLTIKNNGSVGVGVSDPSAKFEVNGTISAFSESDYPIITSSSFSTNTNPPYFMLKAARGGDRSAPLYTQSGDTMGYFEARSHGVASPVSGAGVQIRATENHSSTTMGSSLTLKTVPNGSKTPASRLFIDHDGDVGIGTSAPEQKLHINGTGTTGTWGTYNIGGGYLRVGEANSSINLAMDGNSIIADSGLSIATLNADDITIGTNNTAHMRITSDGKIGIGTVTPEKQLHLKGDGYIMLENGIGEKAQINLGNSGTMLAIGNYTGTANSVNIDISNGYTGIGTNNPAQKLDVNGNIAVSGSTVHTSDRRLKREIASIDDPIERLMKIEGVTYFWKDKDRDQHRQIGVIAQDVQKQFPEAVYENKETGFLSVNYSGLIGPLIEGIKELFKGQSENKRELSSIKKENIKLQEQNSIIMEQNEEIRRENRQMKSFLCKQYPEADFCVNQ